MTDPLLDVLFNSKNDWSPIVGKIFQEHALEIKPQNFLQLTEDCKSFVYGIEPKLFKKLEWKYIQILALLDTHFDSILAMRIECIKNGRMRRRACIGIKETLEIVYEEILRHLMRSLMEEE